MADDLCKHDLPIDHCARCRDCRCAASRKGSDGGSPASVRSRVRPGEGKGAASKTGSNSSSCARSRARPFGPIAQVTSILRCTKGGEVDHGEESRPWRSVGIAG